MADRWLIRAASGPKSGAGHVSRCLALARALPRGDTTVFVLDRGAGGWAATLAMAGFATAYEGDEPGGPYRAAILDVYDRLDEYAERYREAAAFLVAIDDFGAPPASANLVVHPAADLAGDTIAGVVALCGPTYALINRDFAVAFRQRDGSVQRIAVGFGMLDPGNATGLVLEALTSAQRKGRSFEVDILLAAGSEHERAVRAAAAPLEGRLHIGLTTVLPILSQADLAIGSGGVSLVERLAAGVPTVTVTIAENQRAAVTGFARAGATIDAGSASEIWPEALAAVVEDAIASPERLREISRKGGEIVDGRGPERVVAALLARTSSGRSRDAGEKRKVQAKGL